MICHRHKIIFIHISKCAGSSIETAFGIDVANNSHTNNHNFFGWNEKNKLFLQHATPQELFDYGFINKNLWDKYYKFIVVRNPWDRAFSDYYWLSNEMNINDKFSNFIKRKNRFKNVLTIKNGNFYRGDHLKKQYDYFFLNNEFIKYDKIIRFEHIDLELEILSKKLGFSESFFKKKINVGEKKINHYSKFYNFYRRKIIDVKYSNDIELLNYCFEDLKEKSDKIKSLLPSNILIRL